MHTLFDPTWFAKLLPEREAHLRVLTPGAPPNNLPSGGRRRPERRAGACGLAGRVHDRWRPSFRESCLIDARLWNAFDDDQADCLRDVYRRLTGRGMCPALDDATRLSPHGASRGKG
jgi:hypothetical protein